MVSLHTEIEMVVLPPDMVRLQRVGADVANGVQRC